MTGKCCLFAEIMDGVGAGKTTLRTIEIEDLPALRVDAALIRETGERLNVSRAVFARRLRVATRTLEIWEQGAGHSQRTARGADPDGASIPGYLR